MKLLLGEALVEVNSHQRYRVALWLNNFKVERLNFEWQNHRVLRFGVGRVSILNVAHVSRSNYNLLLLLVEEDLPVQRDGLFYAEVPLVESTLVGWAPLHFGKQRFKSLNSVLLAAFGLLLLNGVKLCQGLLCVLLNVLLGLLYHVGSVKLHQAVFEVAGKILEGLRDD